MAGRDWKKGRASVLLVSETLDAELSAMTAVATARDVDVPDTAITEDSTTRENGFHDAQAVVGRSISVNATVQDSVADAGLVILKAAAADGGFIKVAALSDPVAVSGAAGHVFIGQVADFSRNEPLNGLATYSVTIVLDNYVEYHETA